MRYALVREESPATGLRSQWQVPRIGAEEWDAENQSEVALERRYVVGDQVRETRIGNQCADPLDQPRSFQHLCRQRGRRCVVCGNQMKTSSGVTRNDARKQRKVVLDDRRFDLCRRYVDQLKPRLSEEEEEEQEPLLVGLDGRAAVDNAVEAHRWNHDN
jgi:hypothetical protein